MVVLGAPTGAEFGLPLIPKATSALAVTAIVPLAVPPTTATDAVTLNVPAVCVSAVMDVQAWPLLPVTTGVVPRVEVLPVGSVKDTDAPLTGPPPLVIVAQIEFVPVP